MVNVWFTSDTHFGHARIIELCNRPFESVEHMNESMIENFNALVGPQDLVYHLGDVAMGTLADSLPLVGRLNGHKFLVPGNHDRVFSENKPAYIERFLPEYQKVFSGVRSEYICLRPPGAELIDLCHFPFEGDSHEEDRYSHRRPPNDGQWLLHGHVHDEWKINGRQINVGVDVWDFRPVNLDEILAITGS